MIPPAYLFVPTLRGEMLIDSQNKPRMYKTAKAARESLKNREYTSMHVYVVDDCVSKEEFEKGAEE